MTSIEEVMNTSLRVSESALASRFSYCTYKGNTTFVDQYGRKWLTPTRPETERILEEEGYHQENLYVHLSNGEIAPENYKWFQKIALEERRAYTHQMAYEISLSKGIKPVLLEGKVAKLHIKEITENFLDESSQTLYEPLVQLELAHNTEENIATYIVVDDKTIVVCDEFGRTYLLKVSSIINEIVNALVDAGYRRTMEPWLYVRSTTMD